MVVEVLAHAITAIACKPKMWSLTLSLPLTSRSRVSIPAGLSALGLFVSPSMVRPPPLEKGERP
jgi:hypothetical protein